MSRSSAPDAPRKAGRLSRLAPIPFVAVSAILVTLVVFTPVLLSNGPSPLLTRGELTVDGLPHGNWTAFYVWAFDSHAVRYRSVTVALGTGFLWNGTCPTSGLTWATVSATQVLVASTNTTTMPVVVNATAVYPGPNGPVIYAGEFAFDLMGASGQNPVLSMTACTQATPGVSVPSASVAVASFPVSLALVNYGSGGPP